MARRAGLQQLPTAWLKPPRNGGKLRVPRLHQAACRSQAS
jgi:hypothetical protein